jgi:hypothetical protein
MGTRMLERRYSGLETIRGDLHRSEAKVLELEAALKVLAWRYAPDLLKRKRGVDSCPTIDMRRKCVFSKKTDADCAECLKNYAIRQARNNINRRK